MSSLKEMSESLMVTALHHSLLIKFLSLGPSEPSAACFLPKIPGHGKNVLGFYFAQGWNSRVGCRVLLEEREGCGGDGSIRRDFQNVKFSLPTA